MNKIILFLAAVLLVFCTTCEPDKDKQKSAVQEPAVSEITIDSNIIEKIAKIAAMFDINEEKAMALLKEEKITTAEYKEVITKIALDTMATNIFVEKKTYYKEKLQE
jgi:hypothetical protein